MKLLYLTHFTPTFDNYNGPSALMFHLLNSRNKEVDDLMVFSTNQNSVPKDIVALSEQLLGVKINIINKSFTQRLQTSNKVAHLTGFFCKNDMPVDSRYELSYNILEKIEAYNPDLIFLYPHNMLSVARQLSTYKIIVCGPDCASLHYSRALRDSYVYYKNDMERTVNQYLGRIKMEREWSTVSNAKLFMVGNRDAEFFNVINGNNQAVFIPHPHYKLTEKKINLKKNKITILVSGKYDIYTYTDITKFVDVLISLDNQEFKKQLSFTFLGKGWEPLIKKMSSFGYEVDWHRWVEDYVKFISNFDIQLFPISVGSGTKGKVLDALSTGLLCIGSEYAFENIAVKHERDCLIYEEVCQIPDMLMKILENRKSFENIALNGKNQVRQYHDPNKIFKTIVDWGVTDKLNIDTKEYYSLSKKS